MSHTLEFYFDCSSPWTWLAFEYAQRRLADLDVAIAWKPILVGGVFNTVNPSVYAARENPVPAKAAYMRKDLQDWARFVGVEIGWPAVFPVNSVKAMRGAIFALEQDCLAAYARAVFKRYWTDLADISQDDVLGAVVESVGLDRAAFFAAIASPPYKDRLRENTEELIARGGFGSPTLFLDGDDMYFGNDRVDLLRWRIEQIDGGPRA
ncbi:MAG: 2-hydroxychromene-2-carboxylate isomerase [Gammaproteobacteria bacterium]|nr:2-hydroxychromene-2-carboxylate isomerase [Gammaproteobacteria bacterium]